MDVHPYAFRLFLPLQRIHKCGSQIILFQFQRHFQFRAKYSTPEYRVVGHHHPDDGPTQRLDVGECHQEAQAHHGAGGFHLAGPTGCNDRSLPAATKRRPVTANSRARTAISAHAGQRPHSQNIAIAAITRSLSARGSRNFAKVTNLIAVAGNVAVHKVRHTGQDEYPQSSPTSKGQPRRR